METGGADELELGSFLDLFASSSQDGSKQNSMDLDGLGGLPDLDEPLALNPPAGLLAMSGSDLLASALRTHNDAASMPLAFAGPNIRTSTAPVHGAMNNNAAATPTAAGPAGGVPAAPAAAAAAAAKFTIRPMPARKTQTGLAAAAAAAAPPPVKAEPASDGPAAAAPRARSQPQQQQQQDEDVDVDAALDSDTEPATARSGGGGKRRKRIRNAKQQELNRLAQQRYRERRKAKYSTLQETVDELSGRLGRLSTLEAANSELQQRNGQLEVVVKEQQTQLTAQRETIARQAQQLQTQAVQLSHQAKQLQAQVQVIQQQDRAIGELRGKLAGASSVAPAAAAAAAGSSGGGDGGAAPDVEQLNEQIALAMRAVLAGVSSMASLSLPSASKDASAQMQHMVAQLPDALLQQIRTCCREVALHLKKTEVKEQPHAISVPCC